MNVKRMEKLAAHLETTPAAGFDMSWWVSDPDFDGDEDVFEKLKQAKKNDYKCGMAACVGGHACLVFPHLLSISRGGNIHLKRNPNSGGHFAIAKVLGLCSLHAADLTAAYANHQTPTEAAQYIRSLIKANNPCCAYEN